MAGTNGRRPVSELRFTILAIERLRTAKFKGINTVHSGYDVAFRAYFGKAPDADLVGLVKRGKLVTRDAKSGAMLYKPGDAPVVKATAQSALAKMGLSI